MANITKILYLILLYEIITFYQAYSNIISTFHTKNQCHSIINTVPLAGYIFICQIT